MTDAAYLIRLSVKPECVESFRTHTLALMRAASLLEGCAQVQLLQGASDPSQFVLLESWSDEGYYLSDAHQQADYRTAYFEATKSMLSDVRIELLRPVSDDAGAVPVEPTIEPVADVTPDPAADAGPPVA